MTQLALVAVVILLVLALFGTLPLWMPLLAMFFAAISA